MGHDPVVVTTRNPHAALIDKGEMGK